MNRKTRFAILSGFGIWVSIFLLVLVAAATDQLFPCSWKDALVLTAWFDCTIGAITSIFGALAIGCLTPSVKGVIEDPFY
jgi:hypothetical protein